MIITAVILAAGQGTRMRSSTPKVLHSLLGQPMVWYALTAAKQVTGSKPVLVIGYGGESVRRTVGEAAQFVLQEPQLGTGHAVQQAKMLLQGNTDLILVTSADMPLLSAETLERLIRSHQAGQTSAEHANPITMLTVMADDPRGFGRVIRDPNGEIEAIVEEAHATPEQLAIKELNAGAYCFNADWLWEALEQISPSPKGEYYLTDLVGIAIDQRLPVRALVVEDSSEAIGINNRVHLAEAETILRRRVNQELMLSGVTIIDPHSAYIEAGVVIGADTIIWPNTYLYGDTKIGQGCILGPNTILRDTHVGDQCQIFASVIENAFLEEKVDVGPFAHVRKGSHLARGVHMGNFGEIKNSYLGSGTKMGHFSYIGDANIGTQVNIGAGTITCNFDGQRKHPTEIGEGVFVGSDTMLVAPVKLGNGARTGAGSVVTKDVPANTLVVGMPARAIRKIGQRDK